MEAEHKSHPKPDAERHAQQIRLSCLQFAVAGSGANGSASNALDRAKAFEYWVINGEMPDRRDTGWAGQVG